MTTINLNLSQKKTSSTTQNAPLKKVRFVCNPDLKRTFQFSHCLYSISIGNIQEYGANAFSTLSKISATFNECTILLADSLQRLSGFYYPSNSLFSERQSIQAGDDWLFQHMPYMNFLAMNFNVLRWNDIRKHPDFDQKQSIISKLYKASKDFQVAMQSTIDQFSKRSKTNVISPVKAYLLEECSALLLLADMGFNFEIYPSKRNPAMHYIFEHLIAVYQERTLQPISLEIRSRKNPTQIALTEDYTILS